MPIARLNLDHSPFLGIFALATDQVALLPAGLGAVHENRAAEVLDVKVVRASISRSPLLGVLSAGNSNGLVVSNLLEADEERALSKLGIRVARVPDKHTAMGNMVLANDKGALVSPELSMEALTTIREALGVPVERGTIAGLRNVGAAAVATNRGALVHPDVSEEELKVVESVLGVPADVGTACGGVKYVGACLIATSHGVLVGESTTGPELGRIESSLGFI